MDPVRAVFVYGTLKTGQCREHCWPCIPRKRQRAWTRGMLYDTGPYPAVVPGDTAVGGQLWYYDAQSLPQVCAVLDEIEDYQPGRERGNLYIRAVVDCFTEDGETVPAYIYFYARTADLPTFQLVKPQFPFAEGFLAVWPDGGEW
jgi:gamma-glutamylcyclotransferase (GGCT)/AIG2-like uncharacterized protein YtfP